MAGKNKAKKVERQAEAQEKAAENLEKTSRKGGSEKTDKLISDIRKKEK